MHSLWDVTSWTSLAHTAAVPFGVRHTDSYHLP